MPDDRYPDPREEDIVYEDRRISRPDSSLPDWEVPDSTYRPVPIVWFTRALILQIILQTLLGVILKTMFGLPWLVLVAASLLVSGMLAFQTWESGMSHAGTGWRVATIVMLALTFGFAAMVLRI